MAQLGFLAGHAHAYGLPNEESVLTLMGSVTMEHRTFARILPRIIVDEKLFPDV